MHLHGMGSEFCSIHFDIEALKALGFASEVMNEGFVVKLTREVRAPVLDDGT